ASRLHSDTARSELGGRCTSSRFDCVSPARRAIAAKLPSVSQVVFDCSKLREASARWQTSDYPACFDAGLRPCSDKSLTLPQTAFGRWGNPRAKSDYFR